MGSYIDFKNFSDTLLPEGSGGKPTGNLPLTRQSSIYSLTFDALQSTLGGLGRDFGSMNMDELLKNIWTAEETQVVGSSGGGGGGNALCGTLQKQGSLTLPRTLSQKTVDEVWKDLHKESTDAGSGSERSKLEQRQPTLGEMTLEDFLLRAGVVREDTQAIGRQSNNAFYAGLSQQTNDNASLSLGFQHPTTDNLSLCNQITESFNSAPKQSSSSALNVTGIRPSQQQPIFPKETTVAFTSPVHTVNKTQLANQGARGPIVGMVNPSLNNTLVQGATLQSGPISSAGLGDGIKRVAAGSPVNQLSSDVIMKSSVDTPSESPPPYVFSGGARGRKYSANLEKAVERRHRRMIKNRESAARSRARKQAYTLELEAEVAKLKQLNQELEKKQAETMEFQQNKILETMNMKWANKRRCLRRTLTGPW